jgi:exodeoxyribonuclease X
MLLRIIDFETTGIPVEGEPPHAVCEVGWADVVIGDDGQLGPEPVRFVGSRLCDPGRPMRVEALAIHHISDAMIAVGGEAGTKASPPTLAFRRLMEDSPAYFVAHNADFERAVFAGGGTPWLCTYKAALRAWPDAPGHSNQMLRYWLGLDLDARYAMPPHRAGPDAFVTAHILIELLRAGTKIEDMARWSSGPALLPRITFGKHKGAKWGDVPADYLQWIVIRSDMDRDAKANAKHELKARGLA